MGRVCECDRRSASAAQTGIAAAIIKERTAVSRGAADNQAEEHGVIAAWNGAVLFALDVGDDALEHRDAMLVLVIADAAKPISRRIGRGEAARQRLLFGRKNVEHEMRRSLHRAVHVVVLVDRDEDERRVERHGGDRARRHPERLTGAAAGRQDGNAGPEPPQQLAELRWVHSAHLYHTRFASTRGFSTARAGTQLPVARTSRSASPGRRASRPTTRSISAGQPTASPIMRSSIHLPMNSRRRARAYGSRLAPVASVSRIAAAASSAPRNAL